MASERPSAAGEVPQAAPDATSQAAAKLKRRRVKREGPPQLQFLIATDLSQFRNENAKRSVRSQAMIHWRHEEDKKRRKPSLKNSSSPTAAGKSYNRSASVKSEEASAIHPHARPSRATSSALESPERGHDSQHHAHWQTGTDIQSVSPNSSSFARAGSSSWQSTAPEAADYLPYCHSKALAVVEETVTHYEESEKHERRQLRALASGLASCFSPNVEDPFTVFPQFLSKELNSLELSRNCMRAFASDSTMQKWLPLMLSHPHIILSSTVLASTWLDMRENISGDSARTALVKAETIGMVKSRLADPKTQLDDATLTVILHLFAGEMWICYEKDLQNHEQGVATFISRRGGLSAFNRVLAEVAIACCYNCDIIREAEILPVFRDGLPPKPVLSYDAALPESPLYCPRNRFLTIADDPKCSLSTLELLNDMRVLTNIFVEHQTRLNTIHDIDAIDVAQLGIPNGRYEPTIKAILSRLAALPSAYTPGLSVSRDWVYEACRIAAQIYTTAITMGVSFSKAADPNFVDLFASSVSSATWNKTGQSAKFHLTEALYETLQRATTSDLWKNMSGVLYWVSAVGAAAARRSCTKDMSKLDRFRPEAYSVWVRRCLIMTATRTMIVLIFEHPSAIISAQRTLLKVQELIGSHASRRLET